MTLWKLLIIAAGIGFIYLFFPALISMGTTIATVIGIYVLANWFLKRVP